MFKNYRIIQRKDCKPVRLSNFIKKNHYSKSLNRGSKYVFCLIVNGKLRGAATFGIPVGKGTQKYSVSGLEVLECKRFCLAPGAPKNTASWFMAKCMKILKKNPNIDSIVSYADPEEGHSGIMYRASNFEYLGTQKLKGQSISWKGKTVHLRAAYQKINGAYTKPALRVQEALKMGQAKYKSLAKKHIYRYNFKKR